MTEASEAKPNEPNRDDALNEIRDALRGLQFGVLQIVVHDGVVVQIDRTEKRRLRRPLTGDVRGD